jgi:hypothetical protein
MTKDNSVAEATAAFTRAWSVEPGLTPPVKPGEPRQRRRSVTPRPNDSYLSVKEVAAALHVSRDTIIRRFSGLPGVIDLSRPGNRRKRQYRTLRISPEALKQFLRGNRKPSASIGNRVNK